MKKINSAYVVFAIFASLLFFGNCNFEAERNNPYDPKSDNYDPFLGHDIHISPQGHDFGDNLDNQPKTFTITLASGMEVLIREIFSSDPGIFPVHFGGLPSSLYNENDYYHFDVGFNPPQDLGTVQATIDVEYETFDNIHKTISITVSGKGNPDAGFALNPGWNPPQRIDIHDGQWSASEQPQIDMSKDGRVIVTWRQEYNALQEGSLSRIYANMIDLTNPNNGWMQPLKIDEADLDTNSLDVQTDSPVLGVNGNGEAVIAFIEENSTNGSKMICAHYYNKNQAWDENNWMPLGNNANDPITTYYSAADIILTDLKIETNWTMGAAVVGWGRYSNAGDSDDGYYASICSSNNSNWSVPVKFEAPHSPASIALSKSHAYVMTSIDDYSYLYRIGIAIDGDTDSTGWNDPLNRATIFDYSISGEQPLMASIALDLYDSSGSDNGVAASNIALVALTGNANGDNGGIFVSSNLNNISLNNFNDQNFNDQWNATDDVYDLRGGGNFKEPKIVINKYGGGDKAMVIYRDPDGSIDAHYMSDDNVSWQLEDWYYFDYTTTGGSTTIRVGSVGGSLQAFDIAMDSNGNCIAIWQGQNNSSSPFGLYARRYDQGSNMWEETQVISDNTDNGDKFHPRVAMDEFGNAVIVWVENSQIMTMVYMNDQQPF